MGFLKSIFTAVLISAIIIVAGTVLGTAESINSLEIGNTFEIGDISISRTAYDRFSTKIFGSTYFIDGKDFSSAFELIENILDFPKLFLPECVSKISDVFLAHI